MHFGPRPHASARIEKWIVVSWHEPWLAYTPPESHDTVVPAVATSSRIPYVELSALRGVRLRLPY